MTRDELLAKLRGIRERQVTGRKDEEADHSDADDALLEFISDDEVTEAYQSIDMWYA